MSRLFSPIKIGTCNLEHRVVLAPLTRYRSPNHIPGELVSTYYEQRASKGGLLITEATFIAEEAGGYVSVPGIWKKEQIEGWKLTTKKVHNKGGFIFMQLWALGRANTGYTDVPLVVAPGDVGLDDGEHKKPVPLTITDIKRYVQHYKQAAINAVEAGFDGSELHFANGYLGHQFLDSKTNNRTDEYGGSVENRSRFLFEALDAATEAVGQEKIGLRLSPYTSFQQMGEEPVETFLYFVRGLKKRYPNLAYVHIVEDNDKWRGQEVSKPRGCDPFRAIIRGVSEAPYDTPLLDSHKETTGKFEDPTPENPIGYISCSGYLEDTARKVCEEKGDLIAVGRYFISNPDLPDRFRNGWPLTQYDRTTFYVKEGEPGYEEGYIGYAVHGQKGHGEEYAEKNNTKANL